MQRVQAEAALKGWGRRATCRGVIEMIPEGANLRELTQRQQQGLPPVPPRPPRSLLGKLWSVLVALWIIAIVIVAAAGRDHQQLDGYLFGGLNPRRVSAVGMAANRLQTLDLVEHSVCCCGWIAHEAGAWIVEPNSLNYRKREAGKRDFKNAVDTDPGIIHLAIKGPGLRGPK
jgi:hypothetical protein